jgi:penicillin-binding protein 2
MKNPFEIKTAFNRPKTGRTLDWEESALDSQSQVQEIHDDARTSLNPSWLKLLILCAFIVLAGRIFYLQIVQGKSFRQLSESNRVRSQSILAPRGLILDSRGKTLAQNTASFNLVATPFDLPKNQEDLQKEVEKAAPVFGFDAAALLKQIKSSGSNSLVPIVVKQNISEDQAILFETRSSEFLGFSVQKIPVREYLQPEIFSHVLGYTGLVSQADLSKLDPDKYDSVDFAGKSGIEAQYENLLHGINGRDMVEVDATGKLQDVLGQNPPVPGNTLQLSIDKELQEKLYEGLNKSTSPRAAAVALNPKTGQVLAFISLPGFNNNLFAPGISSTEYNKLLNDKNLPLFNRMIAGTYPPGSTVKPMVAAAGLQTGVIDQYTKIFDNGDLVVPNQFDASLNYHFRGWKLDGLGSMDVKSAIAMSSDIYFYQVAGGSPNGSMEGLGPDRLADWYKKFNVGSLTGIDLPGEKPGLVPTPDWKTKYFKDDPIAGKWYLGDTYHVGIGQGDMLVTPLQVAEWTAIIANNGTGYVPRIAERALDEKGNVVWKNEPKVLVSNIVSPDVLKIVQEGMRQTVLSGTAKALLALPITSAGKTGTSQFDGANPGRTHAWFTVYAPYEDPQIVITVLVEAGGEGNAVAEPVARNTLKWWAENRYKK